MFSISNLRKFSNIRGGVVESTPKYAFVFTTDQVAPLSISHIVGTQVRNIDTGAVVYTATTLNNNATQISSALPVGQYGIINPNPNMRLSGTGVISVDDWGDIDAGIYTRISLRDCTRLTTVPDYLPKSITNMDQMFFYATVFNQDISGWDTSNVTDMNQMFYSARAFNQDISAWDTSKVTKMNSMFFNAASFNQPIGNWNTSSVTNMSSMFRYASSFNQPIGNWNTSNVIYMNGMLWDATAFNQPIGNWVTPKAINMDSMFQSATSFNQNLSTWKVPKIVEKPYNFDYNTPVWVKTNRQPRWGVA